MNGISILIPTYKRPKLVIEAINSCLEQTVAPSEIIIGDDSADDLTAAAVEVIRKSTTIPIRYIHNQPSLGQVGNVNMLFDEASGDKLMLLHDDDLLTPNALSTLMDCFTKDPTISVAYGKQYIISDTGLVSLKSSNKFNKDFYRTEAYEGSKLTPLEAGLVQQFPNNAYLIKSDLAKQIKYSNVGDFCDFDFGLRVGQTGATIHFVNEYTAKYRISAVAVSTNPLNDSALSAYLMVLKTKVPATSEWLKVRWLKNRSGVALGQAIATKRFELATEIIFSKYHINKLLTPGGIKRFGLLLMSGHLFQVKNSSYSNVNS